MAKKTKFKKRRKDNLVDNTGGTTRVKPIKTVKGSDGRVQVQQIKYADGGSHYNRYEDGKMVDQNYVPKKMRVKKARMPRAKKMKLIKPGKAPAYTAPEVTLDQDALDEIERRKRAAEYKKGKGKRTRKRIVKKVKDAVKTTATKVKAKLTPKPRRRKVKNLVTGRTNRVR